MLTAFSADVNPSCTTTTVRTWKMTKRVGSRSILQTLRRAATESRNSSSNGDHRLVTYSANVNFWDIHRQVRFVLLTATEWRHDDLQNRIFRTYEGTSPQPTTPFECAIRELQALAEHGTLMQIRQCQECKHFYIANKRTASRMGRRRQKFCRSCGSRARPKEHRLRLKLRGAAGRTGKRVTADPSYAKPSTRQ